MNEEPSWHAFACTGNILHYLDYKQQAQQPADHPAGETDNGTNRDTGACTQRDPL